MIAIATARGAAVLGVTLVLGATGHAIAAPQPQPGQWKVTTKMAVSGLPPGVLAGMGAQDNTRMQCVTPEMVRDPKTWKDLDGGGGLQNCTYKNGWNGNVLAIEATCAGNPPSTLKGSMTFDSPTHYRGMVNTSASVGGMAMKMQISMEGQRVGECPR